MNDSQRELLRQIGADMQADPERGFENWEYWDNEFHEWIRLNEWHTLFCCFAYKFKFRHSPKPLITHDQIPWEWLKWDWVCMEKDGRWYNVETDPRPDGCYGGGEWAVIGGAIKMPEVPAERWRETKMKRPS